MAKKYGPNSSWTGPGGRSKLKRGSLVDTTKGKGAGQAKLARRPSYGSRIAQPGWERPNA